MSAGTCLQCKLPESSCKCEGGFKIIYYMGRPVSKKEADEIAELTKPGALEKAYKQFEKDVKKFLGNG